MKKLFDRAKTQIFGKKENPYDVFVKELSELGSFADKDNVSLQPPVLLGYLGDACGDAVEAGITLEQSEKETLQRVVEKLASKTDKRIPEYACENIMNLLDDDGADELAMKYPNLFMPARVQKLQYTPD